MGSGAVESADLAGVAVDGELGFEAVDLVEGGLGGGKGGGSAEGEHHLEGGGHRPAREAQQGEFLRREGAHLRRAVRVARPRRAIRR